MELYDCAKVEADRTTGLAVMAHRNLSGLLSSRCSRRRDRGRAKGRYQHLQVEQVELSYCTKVGADRPTGSGVMAYRNFCLELKSPKVCFAFFHSRIRGDRSIELKLGIKLQWAAVDFQKNFEANPARRLGFMQLDRTCIGMSI